ncbi:unnamed protein product [Echinostoma caproni]|uniref:VWFC domain-containing protein n=1 Tax=Echinostoma caproni TaxID=27848 RepID=A0A183ARR4_9TREM|nr:unnamed protein product [Echinostoma caproni]
MVCPICPQTHSHNCCDETVDGPWHMYWLHELGGRPHEPRPDILTPEGLCPHALSMCRCEHICAMRHLLLPSLHQCLSQCPSGSSCKSKGEMYSVNTSLSEINGTSGGSGANKRSSLPIIIGVIIAFLAILVGVVLLVNREICQKRGRYGSRFAPGGSSIGGVIFSTLNGTFPRSAGVNGLHGPHTQCGDSITGSCTELRVAFQPQYAMDDEFSIGTQGTADQDEHSPHALTKDGNFRENAPHKKLLNMSTGRPNQHQRRVNGHLVSPRVPINTSVPADNRHSVPEFDRDRKLSRTKMIANTEAVVHQTSPGSVIHLGEHSSILTADTSAVAPPSAAVSNLSCPAEDYYADDEQAFGDDEFEEEEEDEKSEMLYDPMDPTKALNDDLTSSTDSGPFDDGGKPFNLTPSKLTKTRSIKDWNLINRRNSKRRGHRRLSMDDQLPSNPASRFERLTDHPVDTEPSIAHSQSVTIDLNTQSLTALPDHTLTVHSPNSGNNNNNTGIIHPTCRVDAVEHDQSPLVSGVLIEPSARPNGRSKDLTPTGVLHHPIGYDYVRM